MRGLGDCRLLAGRREEGSKKRIRCRCEENDVEGSGTLAKCLSACSGSGYVETCTRRYASLYISLSPPCRIHAQTADELPFAGHVDVVDFAEESAAPAR